MTEPVKVKAIPCSGALFCEQCKVAMKIGGDPIAIQGHSWRTQADIYRCPGCGIRVLVGAGRTMLTEETP